MRCSRQQTSQAENRLRGMRTHFGEAWSGLIRFLSCSQVHRRLSAEWASAQPIDQLGPSSTFLHYVKGDVNFAHSFGQKRYVNTAQVQTEKRRQFEKAMKRPRASHRVRACRTQTYAVSFTDSLTAYLALDPPQAPPARGCSRSTKPAPDRSASWRDEERNAERPWRPKGLVVCQAITS